MPGSVSDYNMEDAPGVTIASANGAIGQCKTENGCGSDWTTAEWDGTKGLGQDLAALEAIMATLPGKELLRLEGAPAVGNGSSSGNSSTGAETGSNNGTQSPGESNTAAGKADVSSMALLLILGLSGLAIVLG
jgi:mannan endo-1,6-alpha-mannosidase